MSPILDRMGDIFCPEWGTLGVPHSLELGHLTDPSYPQGQGRQALAWDMVRDVNTDLR